MSAPVPNLDTDVLTYRYSKANQRIVAFRSVYNVERSINGGPLHRFATVHQTRESSWSGSASWTATSLDHPDVRGIGDSRAKAVKSLEWSLQPEFAERERKAYHVQRKEEQAERERRAQSAVERVRVQESWDCFKVVLDDTIAASFIFLRHTGYHDGEPVKTEVLPKAFANNQAIALHDAIVTRITRGDLPVSVVTTSSDGGAS